MAGCPHEKDCFRAISLEDDGRFGLVSRSDAARAALKQSFQGVELMVYDNSTGSNDGRSPFFPATQAIDVDALASHAVAIVCFGDPVAPSEVRLTFDSQQYLEAAVSPPGCFGYCPRYQAYQGQG